MKTALILGCGYVGSAFAKQALQQGYSVKAITRREESVVALREEGIEAEAFQVHEDDWHEFADTDVDLFLNCVGSTGNGIEGYRLSYVEGNRSVSRWANKREIRQAAIYTSSVGVYPDADGTWLEEGDAMASHDRSKMLLQAEKTFLQGLASFNAVVLRLGGIYGPGRHRLLDSLLREPVEDGSDSDYFLNLIRLEDICSAIWSIERLDSLKPGKIFNVVDDCPSRKSEMSQWLKNLDTFDRIEREAFLAKKSHRSLDTGRKPPNRRISNKALRNETSWQPLYPSYREGFKEFLDQL